MSSLLGDLGTVRHLTGANGAVVRSVSYDAFGRVRHSTGAAFTTLGFTGERMGAVDGTVYLRARHYQPALGRFLQRDTFPGVTDRPQRLNRYVYVQNNPLKYTDPEGRFLNIIVGAAAGALVDYGAQVVGNVIEGGFSKEAFTEVDTTRVLAGAVAGGVGAATFGAGSILLEGAGASGVVATTANILTTAASGVLSGQTYRAVAGDPVGRPEDIAVDVASSLVGAGASKLAQRAAGWLGDTLFAPRTLDAVTQRLQTHLDAVVREVDRLGQAVYTPDQLGAMATYPSLGRAYRGTAIHSEFCERVELDRALRRLQLAQRFQVAPDVVDSLTQTWWDVTTKGQWSTHLRRYSAAFGGSGIPLFYR